MRLVSSAAVLTVATLCALAACGRGSGAERTSQPVAFVEIAAERTRYAPGDTGALTVRNVARERLQYNLCAYRVERRDAQEWRTASAVPPERSACAVAAGQLVPDASVTMPVPLSAELPPGEYRVRFDWIAHADGLPLAANERTSRAFVVAP
jgi:hypothetical protein